MVKNTEQARGPGLFANLPRCEAKNRGGTPCQRPAGPNGRCYYHGGAPGSGAPRGTRNGNYRHGHFTKEAIEERRQASALIGRCREGLKYLGCRN